MIRTPESSLFGVWKRLANIHVVHVIHVSFVIFCYKWWKSEICFIGDLILSFSHRQIWQTDPPSWSRWFSAWWRPSTCSTSSRAERGGSAPCQSPQMKCDSNAALSCAFFLKDLLLLGVNSFFSSLLKIVEWADEIVPQSPTCRVAFFSFPSGVDFFFVFVE